MPETSQHRKKAIDEGRVAFSDSENGRAVYSGMKSMLECQVSEAEGAQSMSHHLFLQPRPGAPVNHGKPHRSVFFF